MTEYFDKLNIQCPAPIRQSRTADAEKLKVEAAAIERRIENATDLLIDSGQDPRTLDRINTKLTELYVELETNQQQQGNLLTDDQEDRDNELLQRWWREFRDKAIRVPVPNEREAVRHAKKIALPPVKASGGIARPLQMTDSGWDLLMSPRTMNETLASVGCSIAVSWERTELVCKNGKKLPRNVVRKLVLKLAENLPTFYSVPVAAGCNGSRGEDRCGSHKGMGSTPQPS